MTIAGSDSGGGAGIQADLKTFAALGVHGASAIACLTAQNPKRVLGVEPCSPKMLRQQIEAVFEELPPAAVKTGMLFSAENVLVVANFFRNRQSAIGNRQLIVDPVHDFHQRRKTAGTGGDKNSRKKNFCRSPRSSRRTSMKRKF